MAQGFATCCPHINNPYYHYLSKEGTEERLGTTDRAAKILVCRPSPQPAVPSRISLG